MTSLEEITDINRYVGWFHPNSHHSGFKPVLLTAKTARPLSFQQSPSEFPALLFCSYDHKNAIEQLGSQHPSPLQFPEQLYFECETCTDIKDSALFFNKPVSVPQKIKIRPTVSKQLYTDRVSALKQHIRNGDIYEINYCITFEATDVSVRPADLYRQLNAISQAPYSAFVRLGDNYIMSSSPELFLSRRGKILTTKPIKGTAARGKDPATDELARQELQASLKERTENVMIVDVARNDLSRIAKRGSVSVEKLYDIESYTQVHQMVSTVTCTLKEDINPRTILNATFPMASMTGAPKIRAMQLIDDYELYSRGPYSGCVGYVLPNGDLDLSVLIRSIFYNATEKYLSFSVGSAITHLCDPEKEYEECLLKAKAMMQVLGA